MSAEQDFLNTYWRRTVQRSEFRHRAALELISRGPVLDIGAGDGLLLSLLKERGINGVGLDVSSEAVAAARSRGVVVFLYGNGQEDISLQGKAFQTVTLLDVLEHQLDPMVLLKKFIPYATEDLIISVPNFSSLPARLQVLFGRVPENNRPHKGHMYWFNWQSLMLLMGGAGLEVVGVRYNAPGQRWWGVRLLCFWLAMRWPSLWALSFVVRAKRKI